MGYDDEEEVDNGVNPGTILILGFVFLPAGLTALGFYLLLRKLHLRLVSIFQIFLLFELLMGLSWFALGVTDRFITVAKNLGSIGEHWGSLVPAVVIFYAALGGFVGLGFCWWEIKEMKANPHRVELKGHWQYRFKFRRTLSQVLTRRKNIEKLQKGHAVDEKKAPLGINEEDQDRIISRYYDEAAVHTLIAGASGSGKTITLQSLILADLINGVPTVVVDFKRSPEFASKLASWAHENNRNFYHFVNGDVADYDVKNSVGPRAYDPLSSGSPTAKADMVLGMREYDTASAVYKANMQQLLQVLFSMLHYADRKKAAKIKWHEGGFYQLASAVSGDNFQDLAIACEGTPIQHEAEEVAMQLKGKTGLRHAMEELQGSVRTIIASEYGRWMRTTEDDKGIDLMKLTSEPDNVVLFSLNSDAEPEFAKYVGSMILSDITNVSAKRRNAQLKNQVMVYVDEFQAVVPTAVTSLLEKSRESKIAVTLAQQSFEQIVSSAPANGEAYLLSILDTCSNFIVHNGMTEDSAERLSKIMGKHWVTKYSQTNRNQSFFLSFNWKNKREANVQTREEEVWVFPPRQFMTLMSPSKANNFKSTAVVINKSCADPHYAAAAGATARRSWMVPDRAVLDTYYDKDYRLGDQDVSAIEIVQSNGDTVALANPTDVAFLHDPYGEEATASPQEYNYLEAKKKAQEARLRAEQNDAITTVTDENEEEWGFTPIEEDKALKEYGEELKAKDFYNEISKDPLSQFSSENISGPPPSRTAPSTKITPTTKPVVKPKESGLPPVRPQERGLPIPQAAPQQTSPKKSASSVKDDTPLPDL